MNERIKELAKQARQIGEYVNYGQIRLSTEQFEQKFAELIVEECAEVCRRQQYYDADDEYKRGVNGGSFTCMNAIRRHFGVE